jgi:hypothetical protein
MATCLLTLPATERIHQLRFTNAAHRRCRSRRLAVLRRRIDNTAGELADGRNGGRRDT